MKNKTKIEIFTQTRCCEPAEAQTCCNDSQGNEHACDCELSCLSADTDQGKARAGELKITHFPAVAINGQPINCGPIANAISSILGSLKCGSCC